MPDPEQLLLADQLCFALYAAANAITRNYRRALGDFGITYPQYLVMITLGEKRSMTSGELARMLKLDAGTLTPMLKRLSAAGLVERERRLNDERVVDNRLTESGRAMQHGLATAQAAVQGQTGMSDTDLIALRTVLNRLTDSLGSHSSAELEQA